MIKGQRSIVVETDVLAKVISKIKEMSQELGKVSSDLKKVREDLNSLKEDEKNKDREATLQKNVRILEQKENDYNNKINNFNFYKESNIKFTVSTRISGRDIEIIEVERISQPGNRPMPSQGKK